VDADKSRADATFMVDGAEEIAKQAGEDHDTS
jgi:hypothetical protein